MHTPRLVNLTNTAKDKQISSISDCGLTLMATSRRRPLSALLSTTLALCVFATVSLQLPATASAGKPLPFNIANLRFLDFNRTFKTKYPFPVSGLRLPVFTYQIGPKPEDFRPAILNSTRDALKRLNETLTQKGKLPLKSNLTAELIYNAVVVGLGGSLKIKVPGVGGGGIGPIGGIGKRSLDERERNALLSVLGIPLEAFQDQRQAVSPTLEKRGIWDDIVSAGCAVFATGAVIAFATALAWFAAANLATGVATGQTDDEGFFLGAVYGAPPWHSTDRMFSASFPPGFSDALATTMGFSIYFKRSQASFDVLPNDKWTVNSNFMDRTSTYVHEMRHILQVEASGNVMIFGYDYMYEFCKAGFSYRNNALEVQAYNTQATVTNLFSQPFFKIWKALNLKPSIGFPTTTYVAPGGILVFSNGIMQVNVTDFSNAVWYKRYRYFVKSGSGGYAIWKRAQCTLRQPLSPNAPICRSEDPPNQCNPAWIAQQNRPCKNARASWASYSGGWATY